ncbi:YtxH domain-containing protein [Streptomyces sioyaensis]|uniref:YtxH domain-containing protein n=1 Tax=Streptomyces sioyaensis TaxID=67364 RepID=A0A4Q1R027_9ACTN|nr:YtxH domain-containing protein [Streptomyces sioyaensis]MBM4796289.1 YtxH domain-containing protein [Streptomyces sioyaensis]RXS64948.1 YtxH domain-containing protein [Streptomyces sioyaensis]
MRYRLTFIAGLATGYVLGARAGRERYEQLRKAAQRVTQNPAVRNTAESAALTGRDAASKAFGTVSAKVGERMPHAVGDRVRSLREQRGSDEDEWGTSNT